MTHIIFDMDGVLLDSEPMHQQVIYEVFQLKNIPLDRDYIQTLTGMSAFPMWQKIKNDAQRVETVEELVQFHKDYFFQKLPELHVAPVPHVKFLKVAEWYALPPTQFTVIEDSTNGAKAAKSAGMHCIGFQTPLSGGQNLQEADRIIHSMNELLTR